MGSPIYCSLISPPLFLDAKFVTNPVANTNCTVESSQSNSLGATPPAARCKTTQKNRNEIVGLRIT